MKRNKVRVFDYPDGTIAIKYDGTPLPYVVFDKVRQVKQADIVSDKCLSAVLRSVQRSKKAPKRRGQKRICKEAHRKIQ